jgi:repressor LexA
METGKFSGEKLKELRKKRRLTQEELAERIGVTRVAVAKWEAGERTPKGEYLVRLASELGVSPSYFFESDNQDKKFKPEKLAGLRKKKGLSQEELAELVGVTRSTVAKWEIGNRVPKGDHLMKLSDVLGVPPSYFFEGEEKPKWDKNAEYLKSKIIPIAIYGEAQAGSFGGYTYPTPEEYFPTPEAMIKGLPPERVFWIRVEGESMKPLFQPGDLVLVADPSYYEVKEGAPVVVLNGDGELTVKYYHHDTKNKVVVLEPANPAYKPIVIPEKELYTGEYLFFPVIAHTKLF